MGLRDCKRDDRPQRFGWAPGKYMNKCFECGAGFIGDKRARQCADCAYALTDEEAQKRVERNLKRLNGEP
jgi:hypothetical protein